MMGGFLGAITRYSIGEWIQNDNGFPLGTLSINLFGCFCLSWFLTFLSTWKIIRPELSLFIGTGFIGSFTTFSTLSIETILLFSNGHIIMAVFYVLTSIIFGLLFSYIGFRLARIRRKKGETI
ncbi:fluoride efflux transporter CrcB [Neobacillus niacini]|uniref:fluoride efflux transporter CrcB n=1 Tax=Neobacillus niacini TaxID=86668 RepID=UPI003982E466